MPLRFRRRSSRPRMTEFGQKLPVVHRLSFARKRSSSAEVEIATVTSVASYYNRVRQIDSTKKRTVRPG